MVQRSLHDFISIPYLADTMSLSNNTKKKVTYKREKNKASSVSTSLCPNNTTNNKPGIHKIKQIDTATISLLFLLLLPYDSLTSLLTNTAYNLHIILYRW